MTQDPPSSFNPARLTLARQRRGLSQTALGQAVEVAARTVARWERGEVDPLPHNIEALAKALEMPPSFFAASDIDFVPVDAVSFRALSKMTARQRDSATAAGAIAMDLAEWLDQRFRLPGPDLPTLEGYDPERAAAVVRERWGLGLAPISNMVHLMEAHGVRVFSLATDVASVDAYSFQLNDAPYVFLNTSKTGERRRFDAAHELGHLVLHCGDEVPHGKPAEQEAQAFAAAFLMPRQSVLGAGLRNASIDHILKAKRHWKVAAMALTHRLHELDLLSEWGYRDLCVRLSQMGYRSSEPRGAIVPETSQLLAKVFKALRSQDLLPIEVAGQLNITQDELNRHVFGLVPVAIAGGNQGGAVLNGPTGLRVIRGGQA
ncbi:Zn-dependent peptidase ImmA, M78 family [Klenkia soli]|uniref:Zn-dependent peptidase ImmA, M78 family n=1 Tax=Klenkia soli TaxID=1052260 RepID=A0A1H0ER74_9ACTN|nr:XRE family transcriptional regulator [Klenkia soli]SDN84851.1 Zn-dependent peptidase ImmA, M78 family [Klenkia soli]